MMAQLPCVDYRHGYEVTLPPSSSVPAQVAALLGAEYGPEDVAEVHLKPAAELNEMLEAMS